MIYEIFSISNYLFIVNNKLNNHLKFIIIEKPAIFYFAGLLIYLPQQFLYFFPDPHARPLTIFYLYMVQIVLCVFPLFYGHLVHYIISIIYIINITNFICYVDKSWTKIILSQQFVYLHSLYTKF